MTQAPTSNPISLVQGACISIVWDSLRVLHKSVSSTYWSASATVLRSGYISAQPYGEGLYIRLILRSSALGRDLSIGIDGHQWIHGGLKYTRTLQCWWGFMEHSWLMITQQDPWMCQNRRHPSTIPRRGPGGFLPSIRRRPHVRR